LHPAEYPVGKPENATVLADMKKKLAEGLAPLDRPFDDFRP